MNKQLKILENKVKQLETEAAQLTANCNSRLELLARNDAIYQNFQGQIAEKQKRLIDMNEFLQMISPKEPKPVDPGKSKVTRKSTKPEKQKDKDKAD